MPENYQVTVVLEPARRVMVVAPADGVIQSLDARLGGTVRESQELAQLDRTEATAKLKMASAEIKEKQALLKTNAALGDVYSAQLEAAQARAELAQLELARCTIRAPFAGRVLALPASVGQYVLKGTPIAEVADTTSLRATLPVDRRTAGVGSSVTVPVEEREATGKVQAMLPLPQSYAMLHELATPFAAAMVLFANSRGDLEPGLRVRPAGVPTAPIATVPKRAVRPDEIRGAGGSRLQVIRNEYVTNVPVQVLGNVGPERVQVSGLLREHDALILGSSVPLIPGTLVRFGTQAAGRGIEGTSPNPALGGVEAGISPPTGSSTGTSGRPGSPATRPTNPPAQTSSGNATPF
jgi:RND family efflux transporter MFP subunit